MDLIVSMVVGAGESERYLPQILERTSAWCDKLFVALDNTATAREFQVADQYTKDVYWMTRNWAAHEGLFRQEAWDTMTEKMQPSQQDYIFLLDADELVVDASPIRRALQIHPGSKFAFTFHEMWSKDQYRVDGFWNPYMAHILIPWRPDGQITNRPIACGREPTYAQLVPSVGVSLGNILHYGYARPQDRIDKHARYMELDAGEYHNKSHLESIIQGPALADWKGGGLLDVPD
jgi:hypothetical protein